jgi:hypothetical protein
VSAPAIDVAVSAAGVSVSWQNVEAVTLSTIPTNVELFFSRSPFAQQAGRQFAFTKPTSSHPLKLPAGKTKVTVPVPDELLKRNMLVEVSTAGKTKVALNIAGEMDVKVTENYGHLRVADADGRGRVAAEKQGWGVAHGPLLAPGGNSRGHRSPASSLSASTNPTDAEVAPATKSAPAVG